MRVVYKTLRSIYLSFSRKIQTESRDIVRDLIGIDQVARRRYAMTLNDSKSYPVHCIALLDREMLSSNVSFTHPSLPLRQWRK